MQVLGFNLYQLKYPIPQYNKNKYPNLTPLKYDTVSFGSMKKSKFNGIELAVIEKYKAPIEKFNSYEDFDDWALMQTLKVSKRDLHAKTPAVTMMREDAMEEWNDFILYDDNGYNTATRYLILESITRDLKDNNDNMPPILDINVLDQTVNELEQKLLVDSKYSFNFNKMYKLNLQKALMDTSERENDSSWIIIPSEKQDPKNFNNNVVKLKTFSHQNWCTKSWNAKKYLNDGEFHIYLESGEPKIAIRFIGDKVHEIQGEMNNGHIPLKYIGMVFDYIINKNLNLDDDALTEVTKDAKLKDLFDELESLKGEEDTNEGRIKIFNKIGIDAVEDDNGFLTISEYYQPATFSFKDTGIDEEKLLESVKEIEEGAVFDNSQLKTLKNLEKIGGIADFVGSRIGSLGKLGYIGGSAYFQTSNVEDLGELKFIGGDANFKDCKVRNLNKLEHIGGYACFENSSIEDFGELTTIDGSLELSKCPAKNWGKIKFIGGDVYGFSSGLKIIDENIKILGDICM